MILRSLILASLLVGHNAIAAPTCAKTFNRPIPKAEALDMLKAAYAPGKVTLSNCSEIVSNSTDPNAEEIGRDVSGMKQVTKGIRETTIYRCSGKSDDGRTLQVYGRVEKFEPTEFPRSDDFRAIAGNVCPVPAGVFYRFKNTYRVLPNAPAATATTAAPEEEAADASK